MCVCVGVLVCSKIKSNSHLENFQHAFSTSHTKTTQLFYTISSIYTHVDTFFPSEIVCSAHSCNPCEGLGKAGQGRGRENRINIFWMANWIAARVALGTLSVKREDLQMDISWWIKNQIMLAINTWMKHLNNDTYIHIYKFHISMLYDYAGVLSTMRGP